MNELLIGTQFISRQGPLTTTITKPDGTEEKIPPVFDLHNFYQYNDLTGTWDKVDEYTTRAHIQVMVQNMINQGTFAATVSQKEILGAAAIAKDRLWAISPNFFQNAAKGIAFQNGFLKLNNQGITELHTNAPENAARYRMSYSYTEQATPRWESLLQVIFANDPDAAEKATLIEEFIGAALLGIATRFGRCLVLFGDGSNGKSTLQAVIQALFPPELILTSNPQTWAREYDRAELHGKRLNVTSELPEREMMESEAFKSIVEGKMITARVIRQPPFQFPPEAAHLFAANALMRTNDFSHGFYRRFIVIPFNNTFSANNDVATPIINEELGGIAHRAIKAVEKAIARGYHYTLPSSSVEAIEEWKHQANPVASFITDCLVPKQDSYCTSGMDLWTCWQTYAEARGFHKTTLTMFGRRITQILGPTAKKRLAGGVFYNVLLNDEGQKALHAFPHLLP